jgi:hypothetical protein
MDTSELDRITLRVAHECGVNPATEVSVTYSYIPEGDEDAELTRWAITVYARSTTARTYTQRKITDGAATLDEAAALVIESVRQGIESGEIKTTHGIQPRLVVVDANRERVIAACMKITGRSREDIERSYDETNEVKS